MPLEQYQFCPAHYPLKKGGSSQRCEYRAGHCGHTKSTTRAFSPCSLCSLPVPVCLSCYSRLNGPPLHKSCSEANRCRALRSDGCLYYRKPTEEEVAHWDDTEYWESRVAHRDGTTHH